MATRTPAAASASSKISLPAHLPPNAPLPTTLRDSISQSLLTSTPAIGELSSLLNSALNASGWTSKMESFVKGECEGDDLSGLGVGDFEWEGDLALASVEEEEEERLGVGLAEETQERKERGTRRRERARLFNEAIAGETDAQREAIVSGIVRDARKASGLGASTGETGVRGREGEDGKGGEGRRGSDKEEADKDGCVEEGMKIPDAAVEEAVKVLEKYLRSVCEVDVQPYG